MAMTQSHLSHTRDSKKITNTFEEEDKYKYNYFTACLKPL